MTSYYIGIRVDMALRVLGNGPQRMTSLLKAIDLEKKAKAIRPVMERLVDAGVLAVGTGKNPLIWLTDLKYATPATACRVYKAYMAERRKLSRTYVRSATDDIIAALAAQGAHQ